MYEAELATLGWKKGFRKAVAIAAAVSLLAGIAGLFLLHPPFVYQVLLFFVTVSFPSLAFYFYLGYIRSKRLKEIDDNLPSALFQMASFPRRTSAERMMESVAKSDYGALSEEFAKASKQVRAGMTVPKAIEAMRERNDSLLLGRAVALLQNSYESGSDMSAAFRAAAEDVFRLQALGREHAAAMTMQKYTLFAGGTVLVPLILGLLLNIVSSLDFASAGEFGVSTETHAGLVEAIVLGEQVYMVVFAAIASVFIASNEGNAAKAVLYFAVSAPFALLVFALVRGISII
ncbi:Type II secretion system (T2SS), protein F [Candidatus Norongarragalina meridionalis]|nr:Type II secretion system (T2SS), protein F [Candidatus Norongarragalina meridionalis]